MGPVAVGSLTRFTYPKTENRYFDSGNIRVKRRYSHFKWLQRRLAAHHPLPAELTSTLEYVKAE